MRSTPLLIVTALVEGTTALLLLLWPAVVLALLFGSRQPGAETLVIGRVAGAGVLSIGVTSWLAARDGRAHAVSPVLAGTLAYNAVVAVALLVAGAGLGMIGIALWLAVAYHVALAGWGIACLAQRPAPEQR